MADLTTLVSLVNELMPGVIKLAQSRAKMDELKKFVYFGEGPSDQVAITQSIHLGLPAAASVADRAAAIVPTRASDALTKTVLYTPYRTHAQFTDVELNRLVKRDELGDVLLDGLKSCNDVILAAITSYIAGAHNASTIPDLSAGTDYLAATHTLADSSTYANNGVAALDSTALKAGVTALSREKDWKGGYTNAVPSVLIASDPSAMRAAGSVYASSALDENVAAGIGGVVLPGLGNVWALSSGPQRYGLRVDFREPGDFGYGGEPWVGRPEQASNGQFLIPFGTDFAVYAMTYYNLYVSTGAGS